MQPRRRIRLPRPSELLPMLQVAEFERIGGSRSRKVDVRGIATTNRW
jgi:transcriptional regulator with GAF, ATPase, and Fis domain